MRWVLASGNTGKLRELQSLLAPLALDLCAQSELNIDGAAETGLTFVENALLKARHAASESGLPALADDSGLVVPALHGAPGIYSARYAGVGASDADNRARLLSAMEAIGDRRAYFFCTLVLMQHAEDPAPLIASGRWHGQILTSERGDGGFGYDPIFLPDGLSQSAAELAPDEKNRQSHRGRALGVLLAQLRSGDAPN